ncbi:Os10g0204200 [Oryza sativa Japonica Group]|uniref:Uncharacterized protein n=3 Tax=Oryza TaxID=4527 RepID=A0A8J8XHH8_ORYSJ|nr:hypothetical protein OsJ_31006 [Oryza sativa Japonica Group]BAT10247.1 Os10g0204200 [Oryza sativa Japonica Group]
MSFCNDHKTHHQRNWMYRNSAYNLEKPKPKPKAKKKKRNVEKTVEEEEQLNHRLRLAAIENTKRKRNEERELRKMAREFAEKNERAKERAGKVDRAQHAKEAGPEATSKAQCTRCT